MITRHILTLPKSGRRVHYRKAGNGPLLLMVHQSPRSSAEYEALIEKWAPHFTCIAPDTPGFGQSDPLPGAPEIEEFADGLVEFLDALGVKNCAAYGFHSGGIILVTALKRHRDRFSCLAIGGYAIWTEEEMRIFGDRYLPEFHPSSYGEHLTWLWNRMLEQSWFFPWFDIRDEARLSVAHADLARVNQAVMEMLDAGNAYQAGYGAVLRASRDIPGPDEPSPPVLITAYEGDPLQAHIDRLGKMPASWGAEKVSTPEAHQETSLAFLRQHAGAGAAGDIPEDEMEGWLPIDGGLIHWRGTRGAERLILHAPGAELEQPDAGELVIDVPGHGLSSPLSAFDSLHDAVEAAAQSLGAEQILWPKAPDGDPELLYPDLTPDRFGSHLLKAWAPARAEALFLPWYAADKDHALPVSDPLLDPANIAVRARARLRAGGAARDYHTLLQTLSQGTNR